MALDVGIGDGTSPMPLPDAPSLSLTNAYYCFLHPLLERLATETGQYIDLYDDASFVGENLSALERMVTEARKLIQAQPSTWEVHTGTQLTPEHKELYTEVSRTRFLALLDDWERIIVRAKEIGRPVVCFGD